MLVISAKYAAIGDEKGTLVYIFDKDGLCGKIETTKPIVRVKIAEQGTVALLLEENGVSYLKLCDKAGKRLQRASFMWKQRLSNGYCLIEGWKTVCGVHVEHQ